MYFKDSVVSYDDMDGIIHAVWLYLDLEYKDVTLLKYPLIVTKLEFKILELLVRAFPESLTPEHLCQELNISRKSLSVHICSINKKAAPISERRLVLFSNGYCLNEFM